MKKILVSLTAVSICLVACGKEGDFKKAINDKINQNKNDKIACLHIYAGDGLSVSSDNINGVYTGGASLSSTTSTNNGELEKFKAKAAGAYVISQHYDKTGKNLDDFPEKTRNKFVQLDSLTGAGLLTKSTESLVTYGLFGDKKADGFNKYTMYTLTEAGKSTTATAGASYNISANDDVFNNGGRVFCYAHPVVEKIENYTEADRGGNHMANVKYSYKYVDVADWINKPGVKEAFPEIAKTLDNPDKTAKINLFKTNNGWSTDL